VQHPQVVHYLINLLTVDAYSRLGFFGRADLSSLMVMRLNLEIQLTIKISEKTEQRRLGVIPAPPSSQKTSVRKANQSTPMVEVRN